VVEAPVEVRLPAAEIERIAFVEIRDRRNRELVKVIELLSPSNKRYGSSPTFFRRPRATGVAFSHWG
jgi:hypothetical protein